jgi:hypothetical protein
MIGDAIKTPEMLDLDSYYQQRMIYNIRSNSDEFWGF